MSTGELRMLFADERLNFFRPLTSKYREQVVACLRALYARSRRTTGTMRVVKPRDEE